MLDFFGINKHSYTISSLFSHRQLTNFIHICRNWTNILVQTIDRAHINTL